MSTYANPKDPGCIRPYRFDGYKVGDARVVEIFRGGTNGRGPCLFCNGDYPRYAGPFNAPMYDGTPPFNSHADAAQGQGYLNLNFPLVPMLKDTWAHQWMINALRGVHASGDIILTNWIPSRCFVTDLYWEVTGFDKNLDGVYLKPVAYRRKFDYDAEEIVYELDDDYMSMLSENGIDKFVLGTPGDDDKIYGYAHNSNPLCTFGHNIAKWEDGKEVGGYDEYFGEVVLGYELEAEGENAADQIKLFPYAHFAIYFSSKVMAFECQTQV